ncbi:MAG TPA: LytTR family DNA-binding domain-containing protein [Hanamia sp.]|nr:LytTR family DNA-binding domain-containing protein [Hanamia sp.]
MSTIKCLIVDDEPIGREILENFVKKINFLELVAVCEDAFEALDVLESQQVDLLLSDIQMPEINGLEFVRSLPAPPVIIFITAYDEYAVNSFDLGVADYLLKPVTFERFLKAVNKARLQIDNLRKVSTTNNENPGHFFLKANNKLHKILFNEVQYIESTGDYIKVFTADSSFMSYSSMKTIESKLPEGLFIRIHNSYLVAIEAIKTVDVNTVELLNGAVLSVAKSRKEALFVALQIKEQ